MNQFPLIGLGLVTTNKAGETLDAYFPKIAFKNAIDGDRDLFIGNLSNPKNFGANVNSAILVNNGKGNFTADFEFQLNAKVTDATWIDVNDDGQVDLVVPEDELEDNPGCWKFRLTATNGNGLTCPQSV